jgi:hypothetical protein
MHALTTLNDPTWTESARVLAERALKSSTNLDARLAFVFHRVLARMPSAAEEKILRRLLDEQLAVYRANKAAANKLLAVGSAPSIRRNMLRGRTSASPS